MREISDITSNPVEPISALPGLISALLYILSCFLWAKVLFSIISNIKDKKSELQIIKTLEPISYALFVCLYIFCIMYLNHSKAWPDFIRDYPLMSIVGFNISLILVFVCFFRKQTIKETSLIFSRKMLSLVLYCIAGSLIAVTISFLGFSKLGFLSVPIFSFLWIGAPMLAIHLKLPATRKTRVLIVLSVSYLIFCIPLLYEELVDL